MHVPVGNVDIGTGVNQCPHVFHFRVVVASRHGVKQGEIPNVNGGHDLPMLLLGNGIWALSWIVEAPWDPRSHFLRFALGH